ncbi:hypothetical protein BGZ89_000911 [Linnemannia elongata]|nr:hypothetical protein BGZ89_000911 [Linnemannia elongata]
MPNPDLRSQLCDMPAMQKRLSSCVKPGFDTGTGDGSSGSQDPSNSNAKSIVAPVVGGVAGFIAMALLVFLIFRLRRQRRTVNNERLLDTEGHLEEAPDPFNPQNQTKRMQASGSGRSWCESTADASNQKDVIRIAYIPSIASEDSIQLPELAALGGGPQASFMASFDDVHNKHTSIASSLSTGILDEAVVMAISNKATPQLLRLHTIKSSNSDMIQRSNSLHSSNSIKRTKSQRRVAEANKSARLQGQGNNNKNNNNPDGEGSQLHDALEQLQAQPEPEQQYTPAVMITGPSARSSAQSTVSNKGAPSPPSMVLEPRPLHPSYSTHQSSIPSPVTPVTPPPPPPTSGTQTATIQHSVSAPTALASLLATTSTTPPTISTSISAPHSAPPSAMHAYPSLVQPSPTSPPSGGPSNFSQSPTAPTRDSTLSTLSDGRSTTTRGEGEEIMIFWDGQRGSRTSNL